jgi:hypothetical protein
MYEADQVLKVADVGDTIFIAQSEKVPFSRLLKRGKKPSQMLSQWPVQVYPDRAFAGTLDGTDIASFEHTNREQIEAYGMWMRTAGWMVSRLANLTQTHGVKGKKASKQAEDDGLILAQMIEKQLLSADDTQAEAAPSTPYRSRGAFSWLANTAQSVLPVPVNYRPASACIYSSAIASFLPSSMEAMLEAAATAKKGPVDLTGYVGIKLKAQMATWAQRDPDAEADEASALVQYNIDVKEKRLIQVVDFFEFEAGKVRTFPSWYLYCTNTTGAVSDYSTRSGIFVDMSMWELCFLDEPAAYLEPPKSGGPRGYHDAIYILRCKNPLGQCMVETSS